MSQQTTSRHKHKQHMGPFLYDVTTAQTLYSGGLYFSPEAPAFDFSAQPKNSTSAWMLS